jgi:hypothetical protein
VVLAAAVPTENRDANITVGADDLSPGMGGKGGGTGGERGGLEKLAASELGHRIDKYF